MSLSTGKIIGVVIVTCALLLVLIILVWYKLIKKRNEGTPLPQKIAPLVDKSKEDQKLSFHQISAHRAQNFRERASAAEHESKSDPNRRRSSFQAVFF